MTEDAVEVVRRMWIAYREGGVEAGLYMLHPDVRFELDGVVHHGRDGVRALFAGLEEGGGRFNAEPFTFEPLGQGFVLVAGHGRVRSGGGTAGEYRYFLHEVEDGLVRRAVAHRTRADAEREAHGPTR